ncbi:MAG: hypothetical protein M0Z36_14395 [Thermaerobacter sp.]|nr:hypothetical protein [Thermaerobacter sp.]
MIRERIDHRIEKRMEAVLEPRIEEWLHRFFRTEKGEALIAEVTADFLLSWLRPDDAKGSYFQKTLLEVISQLSRNDPQFREKVIAALNPHWEGT